MLNTYKKIKTLSIEDIISYYKSNFKQVSDFKIGLEYEKISLNKKDNSPASYNDLSKIIEHFGTIKGWGILKDEGKIIGGIGNNSSITLEPGGQFEISLSPKEKISEVEKELKKDLSLLDSIAKSYDVFFLPIGINPKTTYQNIKIIPKKRYEIMNSYFKEFAQRFAPVMMRETAGVQVNIDYKSEDDAIKKIRCGILLSPFLTGLFANSVIRNNKKTNYKSFRALSWLYCDKSRCGFFYKNLIEKNNGKFSDYIKAILNVPMIYFENEGRKIIPNPHLTFEKFMKEGYMEYYPSLNDYILHSSLTFPDVRLKNCIELRNHDSQILPLTLSIGAFYKGIMYNDKAIDEVFNLLDISYDELNKLRFLASKSGLDFEFKGQKAVDIIKKLFEISSDFLCQDEQKYLEEPIKLINQGKCPSDIIGEKAKNTDELISYINRSLHSAIND